MKDTLKKFENENLNFREEFKIQNEIIRRYDEVITDKVSKGILKKQIK